MEPLPLAVFTSRLDTHLLGGFGESCRARLSLRVPSASHFSLRVRSVEHWAGQTVPAGRWRGSAKGPRGRSSTKRKSVQIYYLYSLPKAGRVSVSGTSPVGSAFSPPSATPKCHCSHYRRHDKQKLARGSVDFGHSHPHWLFFLIFQGHFGNPWTTDWKMFVTITWVHVPSRVTESGAKLRDLILLICLKADVPAHRSESGHVKMPLVLSHHRAGLLLRHPFLSCPGKVGGQAVNIQLPNGSQRGYF